MDARGYHGGPGGKSHVTVSNKYRADAAVDLFWLTSQVSGGGASHKDELGGVQRKSHEDIVILKHRRKVDAARESAREAELAGFRACRFQQGFASEGMLCNEPPIPLRVLDFLEASDILRLSLVSKSTHQAAHLLFKREVCAVVRFPAHFLFLSFFPFSPNWRPCCSPFQLEDVLGGESPPYTHKAKERQTRVAKHLPLH